MTLQEIQDGSKIHIEVRREDTSANFSTDLAYVFADCIFVEPFMHKDNILTFDAPGLIIEMIVTREGEVPYNWKNVRITKELYEGKYYHCIKAGTPGVRLNRRHAFRVFIGEQGSAVETVSKERIDVIVKDLSATGVGFLINKDTKPPFEIGKQVHVVFNDNTGTLPVEFDVVGKIVRNHEMDNGMQELYGCVFTGKYPKVERYVASKQIKERNTRKPLNKK